jgi:Bacterial TniB protein
MMRRNLAEKTRAVLQSTTDEERIRRIRSSRWIDYKAAQVVRGKLNDLLTHPFSVRMPNLLLVSQTNNGKTALANEFCRIHTPHDSPKADATITPILMVQSPPVPDPTWLMAALLDRLAIPRKRRDEPYEMTARLSRILPKLGVRILIIDEIHHVLAGNSLRQKWFLNVIKYIGNELKIPIVAVGTQDAFNALSTDPQLANRFEPAVLPRWHYDREFLRLLMSFEQVRPLRNDSHLWDGPIANRLFGMSEGTIGELSTLVNRAAVQAIRTGEERITPKLLDELEWTAPSKRREEGYAIV